MRPTHVHVHSRQWCVLQQGSHIMPPVLRCHIPGRLTPTAQAQCTGGRQHCLTFMKRDTLIHSPRLCMHACRHIQGQVWIMMTCMSGWTRGTHMCLHSRYMDQIMEMVDRIMEILVLKASMAPAKCTEFHSHTHPHTLISWLKCTAHA